MVENEKWLLDKLRNGVIFYLEGVISWNICGENWLFI